MKVRFARLVRSEADREDGLQLHHAPAGRPGRPYWQWYLLLASLLLPLLALVFWWFEHLACAQ